MKKNYFTIGLTGQTGAGKTTVSEIFASHGFEIINCDKIARTVTADGSRCNKELAEIFPECFDSALSLNRRKLGEIVFNDSGKLARLNGTIFPYITEEISNQIERLAACGKRYILLDAPTLFEAGADKLCDTIVSCIADERIRAERIVARDSISYELAKSRISSQKPDSFFIENSDYIIRNNGSVSDAFAQTERIIKQIKERYNG
ncbi:dephospho-CoA kinase [Ruminococcus sp. Marseille-P6503]|uniref:dephospho-CoA kinase n=1 Tax=Ruminococcus sp. Marseille-P6503 TaxID=2364796 RepID=UPI000F545D80|nr:dephospho-CoA kinase [Ruminococcus sp. Marseille-P6503]